MKESLTKLKQCRVNAGMSLQDMAYLLDTDISNLSKFERGLKSAPLHVVLGYHSLTQTSLPKLFKNQIGGVIKLVSSRITALIDELEDQSAEKNKKRLITLYNSLNNISCLQDVSEKNHGEGE